MINKTTILLALAITTHATLSCAMEKPKQPNHIIKTVNVTIANHTPEPFKVPLKIWVTTPESAVTLEEKNAYYQTVKADIHAKLMEVLVAYENAQKDVVVGNHFITLKPNELFYVPASNRFTIRRNWKSHKITETVTAHLETRMECRFEQGRLTPSAPKLHITDKSTKIKESVTMNTLFNMFPDKSLLNLNPTNALENSQKAMAMAFDRAMGLLQGVNPADLPDVDSYEHGLHLADIKKMVAHYLATKKIPAVD